MEIRGFSTQTAQDKVLLLTEELGEIADVFIVLISLCNLLGIDLHKAVLAKESKNVNREWK